MRIISSFRDYYDNIQSLGYDPDLCYLRNGGKQQGHFFDSNLLYGQDYYEVKNGNVIFEFFIIGFCGEIHNGIKAMRTWHRPTNPKTITRFCYSIDDLDKFVNEDSKSKKLEDFYFKGKSRRRNYLRGNVFYRKNAEKYFSDTFLQTPYIMSPFFFTLSENKGELNGEKIKDYFFTYKVPVFAIYFGGEIRDRDQVLDLAPCLSDFGFQKVKDPYTAYQEIAQYVSGVIGIGNPETVEISDEDMKHKKGFDDWSFKRMPGEKKRKKK